MKDIFSGNDKMKKLITELAEVSGFLWDKGWAERNAGNISVNITGLLSSREIEGFNNDSYRSLPANPGTLPDMVFLVTAAGSRMRDAAKNPWDYICILKTDSTGTRFTQWPEKGREPTSELPTHLAIHEVLHRTHSGYKAVVHAHATELLALTQITGFKSTEALNRMLWSMHPETMLFVPKGMGFIPYLLPGTSTIPWLPQRSSNIIPLPYGKNMVCYPPGKLQQMHLT